MAAVGTTIIRTRAALWAYCAGCGEWTTVHAEEYHDRIHALCLTCKAGATPHA